MFEIRKQSISRLGPANVVVNTLSRVPEHGLGWRCEEKLSQTTYGFSPGQRARRDFEQVEELAVSFAVRIR